MKSAIKKYFGIKKIGLALVGVFIVYLLVTYTGFNQTLGAIGRLSAFSLFAFSIIRISTYLISVYKWKILTDKIKKTDFFELIPIFLSGTVLDNLVPGPGFGGEPIKAHILSKLTGRKFSQCIAATLMDSIIFSLVYLGFLIASIAYVFLFVKIALIRTFIVGIITFLTAILVLTSYAYLRKSDKPFVEKILKFVYHFKFFSFLKKRFKGFQKFNNFLKEEFSHFKGTMKIIWADKIRFLYVSVYCAFIIGLDIFSVFILLNGLGENISLLKVMVVVIISGFIGFYSFIPSGTGFAEGSMIVLFVFFGISPAVSGAVTLISRAAFYIITYGIGYVSLIHTTKKYLH